MRLSHLLPMPFGDCHAGLSPGGRPLCGLAMPKRPKRSKSSSLSIGRHHPSSAEPERDCLIDVVAQGAISEEQGGH